MPETKATSKPAGKRARRKAAVKSAQRMKGFDFATWHAATNDPVMRSTIIGLLVLDKAPEWSTLTSRFDRVTRLAPVLRKKIVDQGGLTTPRLIFDNDFDLSFHLRRFRMPEGSTWADVLEDARRQSMTDFDRDRPLWRVTVLEGLPGGKAAALIKMHHAIIDGQGFMVLGANLFDFSTSLPDLGPMPDAPEGDVLGRVGFAEAEVRDKFGWIARSANDFIRGVAPATLVALRSPSDTYNRIASTASSLARFTRIPIGPMSPVMRDRSINYTFGTVEFPFSYLKDVTKGSDHTINDLFMAAVSEGMAIYHRDMGKPVSKLRVNMPISTRKAGEGMENAVTVARFEMPISVSDVRGLMDQMADLVQQVRSEPAVAFTNQLGELSRFIPTDIVAAAAQASDVTASNVPGVPVPVWFGGSQVTRMFPLVATIGAGVNITMLTYDGNVTIGVSSDDAAVHNPRELLAALRAGFEAATGRQIPDHNPLEDTNTNDTTKPPAAAAATSKKAETVAVARKKATAKKPAAKKAPAKKAPAKKAPAKKVVAKKAPAKKAPASKAPAKKAPAKKAVVKRAPAKKAPARKTVKKAPAKRPARR